MTSRIIPFLLILLLGVGPCRSQWINDKIVRNLAVASSGYVEETVEIVAANKGPSQPYVIAIPESRLAQVSAIYGCIDTKCDPSLLASKEKSKSIFRLDHNGVLSNGSMLYSWNVPKSSTTKLFVYIGWVGLVAPVPKHVGQKEMQYIRFTGSSVFYSPYETLSITTTVQGTGRIEYSSLEPTKKLSDKLVFGPYGEEALPIKAFAEMTVSVTFGHKHPLLSIEEFGKTFTVSHYGNINVKEEYVIQNNGARLKGEYSRLDHSQGYTLNSIEEITIRLPRLASNIYYRDMDGNITTSALQKPGLKFRNLLIKFRFPLYGGWQNTFWISYDVPASAFLESGNDKKYKFSGSVFPSADLTKCPIKKIKVSFVFPEGANVEDSSISAASLGVISQSSRMERSTLNIQGTVVMDYELEPSVLGLGYEPFIETEYTYSRVWLLASPMLLITMFFTLFAGIMGYSRISDALELNPGTKSGSAAAGRVDGCGAFLALEKLNKADKERRRHWIESVLGFVNDIGMLVDEYKIPDQSKFYHDTSKSFVSEMDRMECLMTEQSNNYTDKSTEAIRETFDLLKKKIQLKDALMQQPGAKVRKSASAGSSGADLQRDLANVEAEIARALQKLKDLEKQLR